MSVITANEVSETRRIVNVASVPKRSPFRYPGGKTWLVPFVREWLLRMPHRPALFVEPFCGGGIITLTAVMENLVDKALIVELDTQVASVWRVILNGDADELTARILNFQISRESARNELEKEPRNLLDLAFQTILRNRVQRGGILAPGASFVKNGEKGHGVASRWYPETLAGRIRAIRQHRKRIEFVEGDGLEVVHRYYRRKSVAFFVDPPYTAGGKRAGKRLYLHNQLDHEKLFGYLAKAAGPVMMTYDDAPEPNFLAQQFGFTITKIPMKSTHHATMYELVITK